MSTEPHSQSELLTPREVGEMFRVNPKTVSRWARIGRISAIRTMGGHRRFRRAEIEALLARGAEEPTEERLANG